MLRQIIKPITDEYLLKIPKKYLNKKIEILVSLFENDNDSEDKESIIKTAGILLNKNVDPKAWQNEIRNQWSDGN